MKNSYIIHEITLTKGRSIRRFVFYKNASRITATIQCNSELTLYSVSEEFANREINELVHKGYKIL